MHVEVIRWPTEETRLAAARQSGCPRLILVDAGIAPPLTVDALEDWIRLPASDEDIQARLGVLENREFLSHAGRVPEIDDHGILRFANRWAPLPAVEHRLIDTLVERFGAVVSREALARAGWPAGLPSRNVLDVHIVRLRRRIAPLDLAVRTVRSRGYLLEATGDQRSALETDRATISSTTPITRSSAGTVG